MTSELCAGDGRLGPQAITAPGVGVRSSPARRRRARFREEGRCHCGGTPLPGRRTCQRCTDRNHRITPEQRQAYAAQRAAEGRAIVRGHFVLSPELLAEARWFARRHGMPFATLLREALTSYMETAHATEWAEDAEAQADRVAALERAHAGPSPRRPARSEVSAWPDENTVQFFAEILSDTGEVVGL